MILVKTKAESVASSPLGLANIKDEKPTLSFSELLHGAKDSKDEKGVQNGSLILSLGADAKDVKTLKDIKLPEVKETLSSLLKNDDTALAEEVKVLELNPKITQNLSVTELKTLIADAKKFLKDKILDSVEYKKAEVKDLPKTLKSLAQMAKKFGIDVSKITLEEVSTTAKTAAPLKLDTKQEKVTAPTDVKEEKQTLSKEVASKETVSKELPMKETVSKETPVKELASKETPVKEVASKETVSKELPMKETVSKETAVKELASKETPVKEIAKTDTEDVIETKVKTPKAKTEKVQVASDAAQEVKVKEDTKEIVKENIRVDDKKVETIKEIKSTPLFKAKEKTELTTEQIVQTKQFKVEEKTPKSKADETLKLLLRGEKPSADNAKAGLTKDFSVATARVIAPSATTEVSKSIEQLLRGDSADDAVKPDGFKVQDTDGFDVKVKEAKQMMKYLSQDVKTAIEDYKSPFTRVKVQLNPAKMGEVDLTVVQRGKNLHVNLTSNNAAINTLSMNVNDLKAQLTNNGIQNATLNFSDSSQNSDQNAQQQQNRQNERQAKEEYNYFENEEQNEEIINSLEIVIPDYV